MEFNHVNLGLEQLQIGNAVGAIEHFKQALSINPQSGILHTYLALALDDMRRPYAAQHEIGIALDLSPDDAFAHYVAGLICTSAQNYQDAEEHLNIALSIDPTDANFFYALAQVYDRTNQKDKVLPALMEGLSHEPQNTNILAAIGQKHLENGEFSSAQYRADEILNIHPEAPEGHVLQGLLRLRENNIQEAREHALTALRSAPEDVSALTLLCSIKAKSNWVSGLWWHYEAWMAQHGVVKKIFVVMLFFVLYRLSTQVLSDLGHVGYAGVLSLFWLGFCIYTWAGQSLFEKAIDKEIRSVKISSNF